MVDMRILTRAKELLREESSQLKTPITWSQNVWRQYWERNKIVHLPLQQEFISPHPLVLPSNHKELRESLPQTWFSEAPHQRLIPFHQENSRGHEGQFYLISMSYAQLLPRLLEFQLVKLLTLLLPTNSSPDSDGNTRCDSHSEASNNDDKSCKVWNYKKSRTCST